MSEWIWAALVGVAYLTAIAVGLLSFLAAVWPGPWDDHDRTGPLWFRAWRGASRIILLGGGVVLVGGLATGLIR